MIFSFTGQQDPIVFFLLPNLIKCRLLQPNQSRKRKNKDNSNVISTDSNRQTRSAPASLNERRDAFFLQVENISELNSALVNRQDTSQNHQPFFVMVGPIEKITAFYVVIGLIKYQVSSCYEAIELTFKLFHTLNCIYPRDASSLWYFLQRICYEISDDKQRCGTALNTLIGSVSRDLNDAMVEE